MVCGISSARMTVKPITHVTAPDVVEVRAPVTKETILEGLTDTELLDTVKSRQLGSYVVEGMSDEELATVMRARGVEPLIDAKPTRLIHELRRQGDTRGVSAEVCYGDKTAAGLPSGRDAVGADLSITVNRTKKRPRLLEIAANVFLVSLC